MYLANGTSVAITFDIVYDACCFLKHLYLYKWEQWSTTNGLVMQCGDKWTYRMTRERCCGLVIHWVKVDYLHLKAPGTWKTFPKVYDFWASLWDIDWTLHLLFEERHFYICLKNISGIACIPVILHFYARYNLVLTENYNMFPLWHQTNWYSIPHISHKNKNSNYDTHNNSQSVMSILFEGTRKMSKGSWVLESWINPASSNSFNTWWIIIPKGWISKRWRQMTNCTGWALIKMGKERDE